MYTEGFPDAALTVDVLTAVFSKFGHVLLVRIPRHRQPPGSGDSHRSRAPKGFAFVEYATAEEASRAVVGLHGTDVELAAAAHRQRQPDRKAGGSGASAAKRSTPRVVPPTVFGIRVLSLAEWRRAKAEYKTLLRNGASSSGSTGAGAGAGAGAAAGSTKSLFHAGRLSASRCRAGRLRPAEPAARRP